MLCSGCAAPLPIRSEQSVVPSLLDPDPVLVLVIHGKSFRCEPGDVLGREGTVARDEFLPVGTVHRRHAQLNVDNGAWCLTSLASTRNLTEVDGKAVSQGEKVPLRGEHTIRLSTGSMFKLIVQQTTLQTGLVI